MRKIAVVVAALTLCGSAVMATTSAHGVDPPTVEVTRVRAGDLGKAVDESSKRSEFPTALILSEIRSPQRFLIQGHVVPRHNRGIQLSANVICSGRGRFDQFQETFTEGVADLRGGLSITLAVRVSDADLCLVNAIAHPDVGVGVRFPRQAFAGVSLHCPPGCEVEDRT